MTDNAAYWHPFARRLAKLGPRCCSDVKRGVAHFGRQSTAKMLGEDKGRRIAANVAKLPELLRKS